MPRPKKSKNKEHRRQPETDERSNEYKLEKPIKRPDQHHMIDKSLGLDDVKDDLLMPREIVDDVEMVAPEKIDPPTLVKNAMEATRCQSAPESERPVRKLPKQRAATAGKDKAVHLKQLLELELGTDPDLLIRTVVAVVFLTFSYAMFDSVWTTMNDSLLDDGGKFLKYFPTFVGATICFIVVFWFLAITFSVVMRAMANGLNKVDHWIGFAPAEWSGVLVFIAFSAWAAMLPGVITGYFLWKLTGVFVALPILSAVFTFGLLPIFLMSAYYNESAFNIFAPEIIQSLPQQREKWTATYGQFAIVLGIFVAGTVLLLIPGIFFSFLGASVQIISVTTFAALLGLHTCSVLQELN